MKSPVTQLVCILALVGCASTDEPNRFSSSVSAPAGCLYNSQIYTVGAILPVHESKSSAGMVEVSHVDDGSYEEMQRCTLRETGVNPEYSWVEMSRPAPENN